MVGVRSTLEPHGTEPRPVGTHPEDREDGNAAGCIGAVDKQAVERFRRTRVARRSPNAQLRELQVLRRMRHGGRDLLVANSSTQQRLADLINPLAGGPKQIRVMQQQHVHLERVRPPPPPPPPPPTLPLRPAPRALRAPATPV